MLGAFTGRGAGAWTWESFARAPSYRDSIAIASGWKACHMAPREAGVASSTALASAKLTEPCAASHSADAPPPFWAALGRGGPRPRSHASQGLHPCPCPRRPPYSRIFEGPIERGGRKGETVRVTKIRNIRVIRANYLSPRHFSVSYSRFFATKIGTRIRG